MTVRPHMNARATHVGEDLFAVADRRAAETDVLAAARDYVLDREGRWGSAATRYRRLRAAVRTLMRQSNGGPRL